MLTSAFKRYLHVMNELKYNWYSYICRTAFLVCYHLLYGPVLFIGNTNPFEEKIIMNRLYRCFIKFSTVVSQGGEIKLLSPVCRTIYCLLLGVKKLLLFFIFNNLLLHS